MTAVLESLRRPPAEIKTVPPEERNNIYDGVRTIAQAIVLNTFLNDDEPGNITKQRELINDLIPGIRAHYAALPPLIGREDTFDERVLANASDEVIRLRILGESLNAYNRFKDIKSKLKNTQLAMVAGAQLSGKDSLAPIFENSGYTTVTMSKYVKDPVSALLKNRDDTYAKIDMGLRLKECFGDDILAKLGVANAVVYGAKKIVLFGPRKLEEVKGLLKMNPKALLLGISCEPRRRLEWAQGRAKKDPSRADDVDNFWGREQRENPIILQMLHFLYSKGYPIIVNHGSFEDFTNKVRQTIEKYEHEYNNQKYTVLF